MNRTHRRERVRRWLCIFLLVLPVRAPHAQTNVKLSPSDKIMTFEYGAGEHQLDTLMVDQGKPWKTLIESYRVEKDGSAWLLTAGAARQALRHFKAVRGRAVQVARIDLPEFSRRGSIEDFLWIDDRVVLAQSAVERTSRAVFYRWRTDSLPEEVMLPWAAGYNLVGGRPLANLGRLRLVGDEVYDCFPRNCSCVHIGSRNRLLPRLTADDVLTGIPTQTGEMVWADRMSVFCGITPVVDLSQGRAGLLDEVFEDGSFVLLRTATRPVVEGRPCDLLDVYRADGQLVRSVVLPKPRPDTYVVGDGDSFYFTQTAIYQLVFSPAGGVLIRY